MSSGQAPELPGLPDSCWPVDTSCIGGWDDAYDPENPDAGGYSPAAKAAAVALAGQTMRMLTGYRVGGCPVTVRPCSSRCREATWQGRGRWMTPVQQGGSWLNIGCGHAGSCGCSTAREVRLPQPAGQVTEVLMDGVRLDPSAYRLDAGGVLVRTDGMGWPLTNDLGAPDGSPGTWSVAFVPGYPVDLLGAQAAGRLAGEYVKACSDGDCALPQAVVTGLSRNGVTMTLTPGAFPEGKTGVQTVDAYLERWNPHALSVPPMVWSPDLDTYRA